jgi:hypothetical protein
MKKRLLPILLILIVLICAGPLYLGHSKITPIENQFKDKQDTKWYDYMLRWNDSMAS